MCFVNQHKNHLVIAYESGSIVVVDSHTKDIVGNLQVKNKSVARIIQSHPSQLKIAIASDDKTLSVWDLKLVNVAFNVIFASVTNDWF